MIGQFVHSGTTWKQAGETLACPKCGKIAQRITMFLDGRFGTKEDARAANDANRLVEQADIAKWKEAHGRA